MVRTIYQQAIVDAMDDLLVTAAHIAASLSKSEQQGLFEALHFLENALVGAGIYEEAEESA